MSLEDSDEQEPQSQAEDLAPGRSHAQGSFLEVDAHDIPEDASFLEMLDVVNERLIADDVEPVTFGHDCREGICGTCGVMINGQAHGPEKATATCQLHMRKFNDGDEIVIEPWQATSFPILKDLMVDRRFDRIVEAGGYISAPTGGSDANEIPIPKEVADTSMDAAACTAVAPVLQRAPARRVSCSRRPAPPPQHAAPGPAGQWKRTEAMVETMEDFFGSCTNHGECAEACPRRSRSTSSPS